jgi:hypothetical protein
MSDLAIALLRSLLITAGIGVPLFVCGYIMITPTRSLAYSWQNYRTRRKPHRALKDRHFKGLPRRVRLVRVACTLAFFLLLWLGLKQFHIDLWGFLGFING